MTIWIFTGDDLRFDTDDLTYAQAVQLLRDNAVFDIKVTSPHLWSETSFTVAINSRHIIRIESR